MATSLLNSFDSQHEEMIHDAQMDYYGKRLATCSSDRSIRIHAVEGDQQHLLQTLFGHEGPVWQVAWAHPQFGSILASCSYDGKVLIWKEADSQGPGSHGGTSHADQPQSQWQVVYRHLSHAASVNSIQWAPHEYGLQLACGSSDGKVSIVTYGQDNRWTVSAEFMAHHAGCNCVSWQPSAVPGSLLTVRGGMPVNQQDPGHTMRLATGGSDNLVKIWRFDQEQSKWVVDKPEFILEGHSDWVRDVQWSPNLGTPGSLLASCSQDRTVLIWTQTQTGQPFTSHPLRPTPFPDPLWRLSWSPSGGNLLAISGGDNKVYVYRPVVTDTGAEDWEEVVQMEEGSWLAQ